ncbi:uncharacterized protein [Drosophila virilis]|uniref:uncharacterized protein n=1 Tax=Drosophila virilis TaxID=7244 RepID=UPI001396125D|nr:pneumococcal serine-rich repeat protein-like [Drosophila virilis]
MRKNVSPSGARSSSPMWYTAAADYAHKLRMSNPMGSRFAQAASNSRAPVRGFTGQGNRLLPSQNFSVPAQNRGRSLESRNNSIKRRRPRNPTRNVFLAPPIRTRTSNRSISPHVVDMQIPLHNLKDPWYSKSTLVTTMMEARNRHDFAANSDEDNEDKQTHDSVSTRTLRGKESEDILQANMLPLIMVEPSPKSSSPSKTSQGRKKKATSKSKLSAGTIKTEPANIEQQPAPAVSDPVVEAVVGAAAVEERKSGPKEEPAENKATKSNDLDGKSSKCGCPSFRSEFPSRRRSEHNANEMVCPSQDGDYEDMVEACEVTEAHFISYDCDELNSSIGNDLDLPSHQSNFWNAAPQYLLPSFISPGQLGKTACMEQKQSKSKCPSKSCAYQQSQQQGNRMNRNSCSYNNRGIAWNRSSCRQQQNLGYPGQQMHPNSCYSMCSHHQPMQVPVRISTQTCQSGLTELLAQQLQSQMQQAQVQIAQVQMQLSSVCGSSKMQHTPALVHNPTSCGMSNDLTQEIAGDREPPCSDADTLNDVPTAADVDETQQRRSVQFPVREEALASVTNTNGTTEQSPLMVVSKNASTTDEPRILCHARCTESMLLSATATATAATTATATTATTATTVFNATVTTATISSPTAAAAAAAAAKYHAFTTVFRGIVIDSPVAGSGMLRCDS